MIPNRWYLNPDIEPNKLLQRNSSVPVCETNIPGDLLFEKSINFQHVFSIQNNSLGSYQSAKPAKVVYVELSGLSRKVIDWVICYLKINTFSNSKSPRIFVLHIGTDEFCCRNSFGSISEFKYHRFGTILI